MWCRCAHRTFRDQQYDFRDQLLNGYPSLEDNPKIEPTQFRNTDRTCDNRH